MKFYDPVLSSTDVPQIWGIETKPATINICCKRDF